MKICKKNSTESATKEQPVYRNNPPRFNLSEFTFSSDSAICFVSGIYQSEANDRSRLFSDPKGTVSITTCVHTAAVATSLKQRRQLCKSACRVDSLSFSQVRRYGLKRDRCIRANITHAICTRSRFRGVCAPLLALFTFTRTLSLSFSLSNALPLYRSGEGKNKTERKHKKKKKKKKKRTEELFS